MSYYRGLCRTLQTEVLTAAPRSIAGAASPTLAGYLLGLSAFCWPLVIGGAFNSVYDLLLLWMFRRVRPPEEVYDSGPAASREGGLAAERQLLPRG